MLSAFLENDVDWMHACGGYCNCTTCAIYVIEGEENLNEMGEREKNTIRRFQGPEALEKPIRLSCQAKIQGDIKVRQPEWLQ